MTTNRTRWISGSANLPRLKHSPRWDADRTVRLSRGVLLVALLLPTMILTGCTTFNPDDRPLKTKYSPRWELNEVPYEEVTVLEKSGRNVRDGLTGIVDNLVQGLGSGFLIIGTSGYVIQKATIMIGDVIGLIDDNSYSEHVFKGVISKQFLKFGSGASDFIPALSGLHEHTFEGPKYTILDYVGPETFHTKVYGTPSGVGALFGVIAGDLIIRPSGNFILIFGAKDQAKKIDEFGLGVIQSSTEIPFL
jgi:hypothetical protein